MKSKKSTQLKRIAAIGTSLSVAVLIGGASVQADRRIDSPARVQEETQTQGLSESSNGGVLLGNHGNRGNRGNRGNFGGGDHRRHRERVVTGAQKGTQKTATQPAQKAEQKTATKPAQQAEQKTATKPAQQAQQKAAQKN